MTTELVPYLGALEEVPDRSIVEGEFRELPPEFESEPVPEWFGREEQFEWGGLDREEEEALDREGEEVLDRRRDPSRVERERRAAQILKEAEDFNKAVRGAKLEELKSHRREYRRKYRTDVGKAIRTWLKPRPRPDLSKIYFPGEALRKTYLPGSKVRALTTPPTARDPIGELSRPHLESLMRVSAPPPSTTIKAPFRDMERQEGLGSAFARLRDLGKFPKIDWAVYSEIHANGDIDTPSHIRGEVKQLGFSKREIDASLKRLRDLGLVVPTGNTLNGEKELMVTGGY